MSFSDGDGWMEMTKDAGSAGPLAVAAATAAAASAPLYWVTLTDLTLVVVIRRCRELSQALKLTTDGPQYTIITAPGPENSEISKHVHIGLQKNLDLTNVRLD